MQTDKFVKCWVYDPELERVQTRWVLFGTVVERFYGRYSTDKYVHDLTWDSERRIAEKANEFFDFYYFSGDKEHINRNLFMEKLPELVHNNLPLIFDSGVEIDNEHRSGLFMIKGLNV